MANPLLGIGISGIATAQTGLATTGHNISNVNTPGYNRQEVVQAPNIAQYTGSGYLGRGVNVAGVRRAYDTLLQTQSWQAQAALGHEQAILDSVSRIDQLLADPENGLSPSIDGFFRGVNDVAANPADSASRQGLLAQANALVSRFRQLDDRFDAMRTDSNTRLSNAVGLVNSLTAQIAKINDRIAQASAAGGGSRLPNDLLDERDSLVGDLAKQVRANVVEQSDGSYSVFLGNGQPLVLGSSANQLTAYPAAEDPRQIQVGLLNKASSMRFHSEDLIGGIVGGVLAFRDQVLDPAQNALGRLAMSLAMSFNDQHELGQDRLGAPGAKFFDIGVPQAIANAENAGNAVVAADVQDTSALGTSDYDLEYDGTNFTLTRISDRQASVFASLPQSVDGLTISVSSGTALAGDRFLIQPTRSAVANFDVSITDSNRIAAAAPIRTAASLANEGRASISEGRVNPPSPPNPNLSQPVTITFTSAGSFDVTGAGTGNPTGVAYADGGGISYNGWTIEISGIPSAGDVFAVGPNTGGAGDSRNALALSALQTRKLMSGSSETLQGAYAQIVSDAGNRAQDARISQAAQASVLSEVEQARSSATGVNLDQEAANLLRYQQAYQAAGKVIAMAAQLFNTILDLGQ